MAVFARVSYVALATSAVAGLARAELGDLIAERLDAGSAAAYRAALKERAPQAEARLRPILAALPRGAGGAYDAPAVRYALHQDLARNYGWHLLGLDPAGEAWNSSSIADVAALRRLPEEARAAVARASASGMGAGDVAELAATLEFVVRDEARRQLLETYKKLGLRVDAPVRREEALLAVEAYVTSLLLKEDVRSLESKEALMEKHGSIGEVYPLWPRMQAFVQAEFEREVRGGDPVSFEQAMRASWVVGDDFGGWQKENICRDLTKSLVEIEDQGTGRVLLTAFYKAALDDGKWQFQESEGYLRQLGALDESNPGSPRVIIPNWVNGRSNCVGSSDFHDVCCVSECDSLLATLERTLAAPAASPAEIEAVVSALPSSTAAAGRDIGDLQRSRLWAIASAHEGVVPIYGRLFAQWLHHAYPRECPYPHRAGTTKPVGIFEVDVAGLASEEDMKALASRRQRRSAPVHSMPWSSEEEVFAEPGASRPVGLAAVQGAVLLAAFATMALGYARTALRGARRQLQGAGTEKKPRARRAEAAGVQTGLEV